MSDINNLLPVIAILGRPNVGKSTLFNALTRSRQAIVADEPGITRDRQYGEGKVGPCPYILIDTGGIGSENQFVDSPQTIIEQTEQQAFHAAADADYILFMVDARVGLVPDDIVMANYLRRLKKKVYLVVNKTDGLPEDTACIDFYSMGIGQPYPIAAQPGRGVSALMHIVLAPTLEKILIAEAEGINTPSPHLNSGIRIAIVGKPNVGKSTLVNRILGEERVLVADMPGTTRDSIFIPFEKQNQAYTLIDTAGVRRRGKVTEELEKYSVIKTLQAIECAQVCLFMIDAMEGITDQDLHLIGFIIDAGKALVIGVNKWDELSGPEKNQIKITLERRLVFADFAIIHFLSALRGTGVNALFSSIQKAYESAMRPLSTPELTRILEDAVQAHEPPSVNGHRIKLRYAHPGGHNPPLIVIHGNQTDRLPDSYRRYLISTFRKALKLSGTPIRLELKSSTNPYAGKRNPLTPRQERTRKRIISHRISQKKK